MHLGGRESRIASSSISGKPTTMRWVGMVPVFMNEISNSLILCLEDSCAEASCILLEEKKD